ncbi:MAG: hypothetical protein HC886_05325 [Leptolyngbyaceae cyanobacterium SM1_1_3]|nr:hypothetical protein [Leptolyngbyaceae cyanobacterium SM1_1_3]
MKLSQVRTGWLAQLKEVYRLDLRSLALLRLGLGVTLLMAIVHRFSLGLTDEIVAGPRSLLVEDRLWLGQLSELLAGLPWLQGGLLLLTAIAALCLLVGYKTRKAAIAAWILVSFWPDSAFLSGTEALLPSALFWGMFLPLGASYAVDSALNPQQMALPRSLFSAATVALMVRQCFVYGFLAQRLAGLRTGPESLTPLANGLLAADLAQLSPAVFLDFTGGAAAAVAACGNSLPAAVGNCGAGAAAAGTSSNRACWSGVVKPGDLASLFANSDLAKPDTALLRATPGRTDDLF